MFFIQHHCHFTCVMDKSMYNARLANSDSDLDIITHWLMRNEWGFPPNRLLS